MVLVKIDIIFYRRVVMKIGQKIRNAREDLDILQSDMARLIPMNQSNYSKIERDMQEPSMEQLRRICQILKLDPRYLLGIEEFEIISANDIKLLNTIKQLVLREKDGLS